MSLKTLPQWLIDHPRCGAKCRRTGQPCRQPAMKNGRCKMHGGKSGRPPIHGRYSKAAKEERRQARAILKALRGLISEAGK